MAQYKRVGDIVVKPINESGIVVGVNLREFIEAIYIAPYAEAWFRAAVIDLVCKYDLKDALHESELNREAYL